MDQDSFRLLLQSSRSASGNPSSASRANSGTSSKSKTVDASKPLFKPRKIKKAEVEEKYRDRAAERREGGGNDYAHVEAILLDFEKRVAANEDRQAVEQKRKYLGGDGEHSILVKGLDMALLEQNKARAAMQLTEDDDTLEQAYLEASSIVPKQRTREDLIKELQQKRAQLDEPLKEEGNAETRTADDEIKLLEAAKKQGKFKPIGFKPIGGGSGDKEGKKKRKVKPGEGATEKGGERKKKRKVEGGDLQGKREEVKGPGSTKEASASALMPPESNAPQSIQFAKEPSEPEPEPEADTLGDNFDIFAGAGDYEGIELGDSDEEEDDQPESKHAPSQAGNPPQELTSTSTTKKWVTIEEEDSRSIPSKPILQPSSHESKLKERSPLQSSKHGRGSTPEPGERDFEVGDEREDEVKPMRLQPLQSSALPSIREFLASDEAAEIAEKRRKRKEKKKARGGGEDGGKNVEAKINRDFQRLQPYTSKKEASGS